MAALPQATLDARTGRVSHAIYDHHARTQEDGRRPHLGASLIGRECRREAWYAFRWARRLRHEGRMLLLFQTGHLAEPRFVADLKALGATVLDRDVNGRQFGFSALGGHFGGSADAIATGLPYAPRTWACVEFKTHGSRSFATLKSRGVKLAKPEHYAQLQCYMLALQLDRALYLAKNKDTDELHDEWLTLDRPFAESLRAKALAIIQADVPPPGTGTGPNDPTCRRCDYRELCFGTAVPAPSCRSCAHATPVTDRPSPDGLGGAWRCEKWEADIPTLQAQRDGCTGHRYIPILLSKSADAIEYHDGDIHYRLHGSGARFANGEGEGALSSEDIHRCPDKPGLAVAAQLKARFPTASVIG